LSTAARLGVGIRVDGKTASDVSSNESKRQVYPKKILGFNPPGANGGGERLGEAHGDLKEALSKGKVGR